VGPELTRHAESSRTFAVNVTRENGKVIKRKEKARDIEG